MSKPVNTLSAILAVAFVLLSCCAPRAQAQDPTTYVLAYSPITISGCGSSPYTITARAWKLDACTFTVRYDVRGRPGLSDFGFALGNPLASPPTARAITVSGCGASYSPSGGNGNQCNSVYAVWEDAGGLVKVNDEAGCDQNATFWITASRTRLADSGAMAFKGSTSCWSCSNVPYVLADASASCPVPSASPSTSPSTSPSPSPSASATPLCPAPLFGATASAYNVFLVGHSGTSSGYTLDMINGDVEGRLALNGGLRASSFGVGTRIPASACSASLQAVVVGGNASTVQFQGGLECGSLVVDTGASVEQLPGFNGGGVLVRGSVKALTGIDFAVEAAKLQATANELCAAGGTPAAVTAWGAITFQATAASTPRQAFTVAASDIGRATSMAFSFANASGVERVVVAITGGSAAVTFANFAVTSTGGVPSGLFNYIVCSSAAVTVRGFALPGNLLAVNSILVIENGHIEGAVVARTMSGTGGGEVHVPVCPASPAVSASGTPAVTPTPSVTGTPSPSRSPTASPMPSVSPSPSVSVSPSSAVSPTASASPTSTVSASPSPSPSYTASPSVSASASSPPSPSTSASASPSWSPASSPSATLSPSPSSSPSPSGVPPAGGTSAGAIAAGVGGGLAGLAGLAAAGGLIAGAGYLVYRWANRAAPQPDLVASAFDSVTSTAASQNALYSESNVMQPNALFVDEVGTP